MRAQTIFCALVIMANTFSHLATAANYNNWGKPIDLTDSSRITILNARLGSRFSLSYAAAESQMHTGLLGFEQDDRRELLLGVAYKGQNYCFRTCRAPMGYAQLENQKLYISFTSMVFTGQVPNGPLVTANIINPFTPSESLADTADLLAAIAPGFIIKLSANNTADITWRVAFNNTPFEIEKELSFRWWRYGKFAKSVAYRDVAGDGAYVALNMVNGEQSPKHFTIQSFHGIESKSPEAVYTYTGYHKGKVLTDLKYNTTHSYYYNNHFSNLSDVSAYFEKNYQQLVAKAEKFDAQLENNQLSDEVKWTMALTFRADQANTLLTQSKLGHTRFFVLEGRFIHLSTIDVAHETEIMAFYTPWRLKLQIEMWGEYLSLREEKVPSLIYNGKIFDNIEGVGAAELGAFLYHDVGDYPKVHKAEAYNFGPTMPVEENTNFALMLYYYYKLTNDRQTVERQLGLLDILMNSLINRDSDNTGIADVGQGWSTYDVSEAIKRSPENLYFGVKQMVAYLVSAQMYRDIVLTNTRPKNATFVVNDKDGQNTTGDQKTLFEKSIINNKYLRIRQADKLEAEASKIATTLEKAYKKYGYLPVSLETTFEGFNQHSVVIPEGLFLPGLVGFKHKTVDKVLPVLKKSYVTAYEKCKHPYGIRISSGEDATWFSKIMVADVVANTYFGLNMNSVQYTYNWNRNNPYAYQDGAHSLTTPWEGNWYPRGVSSMGYLLLNKNWNLKNRNEYLIKLK